MVIAYLTDVEGRWNKVARFCQGNPAVCLDRGRLVVAPGALLVFGGDAVDRGPEGQQVVRALLDVKERQPAQVVLLAGNRDINKLRLWWELSGHPPAGAPPAAPATLLRWILLHTMGAGEAFEHRRTELAAAAKAPVADAQVVESFVADVAPGGLMRRYLAACQLAFRQGSSLFVHGAVTQENLGVIPTALRRSEDVDLWLDGLNHFYRRQLQLFARAGRQPSATALIDYQQALPGQHINPESVVYCRSADEHGNLRLPARRVIDRLLAAGVARLFVGHTPAGDSPAVLRDRDFTLIVGDSSYSRLEQGAQISVTDDRSIRVVSSAKLDSGERVELCFELEPGDGSPIGQRIAETGQLVTGRLDGSDSYLLYQALPHRLVQQVTASAQQLRARRLLAPA